MKKQEFNQFKNTMELHHNYNMEQYIYVSDKVNLVLTNIWVFDDSAEFEASSKLTEYQYCQLHDIIVTDYKADLIEVTDREEIESREENEHKQRVIYDY